MQTKPIIMKFGGSSIADVEACARVAEIIMTRVSERPIVVVSAMGGFTDVLLNCFQQALVKENAAAHELLVPQLERHREVARALTDPAAQRELEDNLKTAESELQSSFAAVAGDSPSLPAVRDRIVAWGELLSAKLLNLVLNAAGVPAIHVDARNVVITDEHHGRANPKMEEITIRAKSVLKPVFESSQIPVLGGFIGSTKEGLTTTLGRGGSDYSAAIIGAAVNAREIQIWTDVSGVLTADPRVVPEAQTVSVLSYQEAAELAYFGAKVLHPKTIHPAVERNIPVRVCNSHAPEDTGTYVVAEAEAAPETVKAIAHKNGITTLQVTSTRMLGAYGFLRELFAVFDRHHTVVDVVTTSEVSVSLSIDDVSTLPELLPELEEFGLVDVEDHRTIVSVIGEGLRNTPGIAARVFSTLSDINISMISFGASSINLTFMVNEDVASEAIRRLHRACFEFRTGRGAAA